MAPGDKQRRIFPPTAKKKKESRQEGKIAKSPDLAGWLLLFAATFALGPLLHYVQTQILGVVAQSNHVMSHPDQGKAFAVFEYGLKVFASVGITIAAVFAAITLLVTVAQVGFVFASKAAKPKLSRLSPRQGIQRIISFSALWQAARTFAKIAVITLVAYKVVSGVAHVVVGSSPVSLGPVIAYTGQSVISLVRDVALVGLVIAVADYAYQKRRTNQQIRMTREELRDEMRQTEGDPTTRRRIRQQQMKLSRLRMMAAVAHADVVVTNPTHVAVALQYDKETHLAPKVVAKGEGEMARAIREEALTVGVPVVEDPPLARAIHAACEVDDIIPRELYMAVAHLLAFVYSLSSDARLLGVVFRRPVTSLGL